MFNERGIMDQFENESAAKLFLQLMEEETLKKMRPVENEEARKKFVLLRQKWMKNPKRFGLSMDERRGVDEMFAQLEEDIERGKIVEANDEFDDAMSKIVSKLYVTEAIQDFVSKRDVKKIEMTATLDTFASQFKDQYEELDREKKAEFDKAMKVLKKCLESGELAANVNGYSKLVVVFATILKKVFGFDVTIL